MNSLVSGRIVSSSDYFKIVVVKICNADNKSRNMNESDNDIVNNDFTTPVTKAWVRLRIIVKLIITTITRNNNINKTMIISAIMIVWMETHGNL